jgi:hypothetical protein
MLMTRFPLPRQGLWLRKKGMGKRQPIMVGSILISIGLAVLIISAILMVIDIRFVVLIPLISIPSIFFGSVFLFSLLKKDHYLDYAMLIIGDGKVSFKDTRSFIENMLEGEKVPFERKGKGVNEFEWRFKGGHEGYVFVISSGKWAFALGIKDQDGGHEKLVDDFASGYSREFSIPYEEKWSKGWLD